MSRGGLDENIVGKLLIYSILLQWILISLWSPDDLSLSLHQPKTDITCPLMLHYVHHPVADLVWEVRVQTFWIQSSRKKP